jgi:glycosidase
MFLVSFPSRIGPATLAAVACWCCLSAPAAPSDLWQTQSIYQIITDRFFDGDPSNNNAEGTYDPSGHRGTSVHGGDFKGIEQKLDYIKALGATAIWISPIVLNAKGEFHGYAAIDFYKVAPHWGNLADLKHMVQAAHARGLLVIDDVVVNHGGNLIDSADPGYGNFKYPPDGYQLRYHNPAIQYAPPFDLNATNPSLTNLFHNNGFIRNFNDRTQEVMGELFGLDDFKTESPYVRARMAEIYQYWIKEAGFDGFRLDTVKHVDIGFWQNWCPAIHAFAASIGKPDFFMFGEVMEVGDARCAYYTGTRAGGAFTLDSVLDYPLFFRIGSVFGKATGNTRIIAEHYAALTNYDPTVQARLVTFLDNHDQPRFLSRSFAGNQVDRLRVALVFLYSATGIPCLYYGTEQGFNGENDPYDREDMFAGKFEQGPSLGDNFNMTHPLFLLTSKLNNLRRLYPALQVGTQTILFSNAQGPGLLAYTRQTGAQQVLVVLNTSRSEETLPGCATVWQAGTKLVNLLETTETQLVRTNGLTPPLVVAGMSAKIFVEEAQVRPLDPVVTKITPAHDASDVTPTASIVLQFDRAMDNLSVLEAFSTSPATAGTFSWSARNDSLTFKPADPGFAGQALITVRLAETAKDAAHTNHLFAPFEARFRTGTPPR